MAKQAKWSEERIRQLEREGRGKGRGTTYLPWVQVSDFSSLGNSRRVFSPKTGRVHHLFSDSEWGLFLLLEFATDVVDIREQFPLARDETASLAAQRAIKHPIYTGTRVPCVMTTDFLVTLRRDGREELAAFACKRTESAEKARDIEKLEIERAYFDSLGVPHHLVFHSELPKHKISNLVWCRNAHLDEAVDDNLEMLRGIAHRLLHELRHATPSCSLSEYCANLDARTGAPQGAALRAARALIWEHKLITDLHQKDLAAAPLAMFRVAPQLTSGHED